MEVKWFERQTERKKERERKKEKVKEGREKKSGGAKLNEGVAAKNPGKWFPLSNRLCELRENHCAVTSFFEDNRRNRV